MNISKTTKNFAEKRNVEIFINQGQMHLTVDAENNEKTTVVYNLGIYRLEGEKEPALAKLEINFDKSLDAFPCYLFNELELRGIIHYLVTCGNHLAL